MTEFDLHTLLPHRAPMLLLDSALGVEETRACAEVVISENSAFYVKGEGVPSWIGVEYMGQTAALIAGWQLQHGRTAPHLGLLLGTRKFTAKVPTFTEGTRLHIECTEVAVVGEGLATFFCEICDAADERVLASANLSVFRRPPGQI